MENSDFLLQTSEIFNFWKELKNVVFKAPVCEMLILEKNEISGIRSGKSEKTFPEFPESGKSESIKFSKFMESVKFEKFLEITDSGKSEKLRQFLELTESDKSGMLCILGCGDVEM